MFMNPATGRNSNYIDKVLIQENGEPFLVFCLYFAKVISPKSKEL